MGGAALFPSQLAAAWGPPPHFHKTALTSSLLIAKPSGNFLVSTFLDLLFLMPMEPFLCSLGFFNVHIYDLAHLSGPWPCFRSLGFYSALHRCLLSNTNFHDHSFQQPPEEGVIIQPQPYTSLSSSKSAFCIFPVNTPQAPQTHISKTEHTPLLFLHSLFQQITPSPSTFCNHAGFFLTF